MFFSADIANPGYSNYSEYEKVAIQDAGFQTRISSMLVKEEPFVENLEPVMDFGSIPVVVIQGVVSHLASEQWDENQQELLSTSTNSKLIYAHSSDHFVPTKAPESIVEGINWIRANINN